jgi:NAD-dependent deacetylase
MDTGKADLIARTLLQSKYSIVFTGAGISVESGIPPFRGNGGIWDHYDPLLLEINYFLRNPAKSWEAIKKIFYGKFIGAKPNPAHFTLARWQSEGHIKRIITQNIDNLHHEAGSERVVEFHGNAQRIRCMRCQEQYPVKPSLIADAVPRCLKCGGLLKPDFIFFGESIPHVAFNDAFQEAARCDCLLIIGTSGEVQPANQVPVRAAAGGAIIIEINTEPSLYSSQISTIVARQPSGTFLPMIERIINKIKFNE